MAATPKQVLVLGDWFIDEYWFIARHESEISSHTGPAHFRIVSDLGDAVRDLCGAGLVARVLYELRRHQAPALPVKIPDRDESWINALNFFLDKYHKNPEHIDKIVKDSLAKLAHIITNPSSGRIDDHLRTQMQDDLFFILNKDYRICGTGIWNSADTEIIRHYIHARCLTDEPAGGVATGSAVRAGFQLMTQLCDHAVDINLCTLKPAHGGHTVDEATVRIIRTYQFGKDKFKMVSRIDWEPRRDPERGCPRAAAVSACLGRLNAPDVVLLDDHLKGLTRTGIIEELATKPKAISPEWFVRTKDKSILSEHPAPWFEAIKHSGGLELLAVGPDIASRRYPMGRLFTSTTSRHLLTRRSYELLLDLKRQTSAKNLVIASDLMELIILAHDGKCYCARSPAGAEDIDLKKINWTTAFFASLVHQMLAGHWAATDKEGAISAAIIDAHQHCGVKVPESVYFKCGMSASREHEPQKTYPLGEWKDIQTEWQQATAGLGLVECEIDGRKRLCLQVWRAKTDLPGYIACIEQKRDAIGRIWQAIKSFKIQGGAERPLSILLEADPGVGKTFLAESLAKTAGCRLIHYDITQMIHREELLDLFDSVATAQAEVDPDIPVMVFVDEINASLDGTPVYGGFLSPLEGGFYMRRGTKFKLKPCIWMFAGTHVSKRASDRDTAEPEKQPDFTSRIDVNEKIGYADLKEAFGVSEAEARLEQVYLGTEMIRQRFGDVTAVSGDVLNAFYCVDPAEAPARTIRKLVLSLKNVQYGRVGNHNCMSSAWRELLDKYYMTLGSAGDPQHSFAESWASRDSGYISLDFG
jgi:cytidylate kinase